ncbi:hypothetical protein Tco_0974013 [Tanacetum coccineum]|uniref:Uncharacterized protein n=1 Tax=Tanacetum coccineum TaxID=301880 RepID=A0ABQ5EAI3_9ASTR
MGDSRREHSNEKLPSCTIKNVEKDLDWWYLKVEETGKRDLGIVGFGRVFWRRKKSYKLIRKKRYTAKDKPGFYETKEEKSRKCSRNPSKKPSSTKETPKGKALSKGSKTGKSALVKEPVEEPIVCRWIMTPTWNSVLLTIRLVSPQTSSGLLLPECPDVRNKPSGPDSVKCTASQKLKPSYNSSIAATMKTQLQLLGRIKSIPRIQASKTNNKEADKELSKANEAVTRAEDIRIFEILDVRSKEIIPITEL